MIFFKSDILVEFWFGFFVFKLVKVHYSGGCIKGSRQGPHRDSLPKQISSAQLLIFYQYLGPIIPAWYLFRFNRIHFKSQIIVIFLHDFCNLPFEQFLSGQAGKSWLSANLPLICKKSDSTPVTLRWPGAFFLNIFLTLSSCCCEQHFCAF